MTNRVNAWHLWLSGFVTTAVALLAFRYLPDQVDLPTRPLTGGSPIVSEGTPLEVVDQWADWAEAPVWIAAAKPNDSFLIYSDRGAAQLRQWSEHTGERL